MPEVLEQIETKPQEPKEPRETEAQEKKPRQLPVGIGGEKLKEGRETLPAVEVDNEVIWVNKKIEAPFELQVGRSTKLGLFFTPEVKEGEKSYHLESHPAHKRSGILGRVIFKDKEDRLYRDVDLKGTGYYNLVKISETKTSKEHTWGILNQELARRDIDFSERFLKAGIRTHRVIGLIELKEIVDGSGNKISITEAKRRELLRKDDEPVVEIRAFGTRSRVNDLGVGKGNDESNKKILTDAIALIAGEFGENPEDFKAGEYFNWFVKTTAINLARMHFNKWVHGYLTPHNITLDGRIVDLDSVETLQELERREKTLEELYVEKSIEDDIDCITDTTDEKMGIFRYLKFMLEETFDVLLDDLEQAKQDFDIIYQRELERLTAEKVMKRKSKNR